MRKVVLPIFAIILDLLILPMTPLPISSAASPITAPTGFPTIQASKGVILRNTFDLAHNVEYRQ